MRHATGWFAVLVAVAFTAASAPPAAAQSQARGAGSDTPRVQFFAGYGYMHSNIVVNGTTINLNGGNGSIAYNLNGWLGIAGDVAVYHQSNITANAQSLTLSMFQAGPRVTLRKHRRLSPFGEALVGLGHAGGTLYTQSLGGGFAPLGASNALVATAGGGVDWHFTQMLALRVIQADYLYSQFPNNGHGNRQNNVRLSAGIVLSFGAR